jgi:hypothetical protein
MAAQRSPTGAAGAAGAAKLMDGLLLRRIEAVSDSAKLRKNQ